LFEQCNRRERQERKSSASEYENQCYQPQRRIFKIPPRINVLFRPDALQRVSMMFILQSNHIQFKDFR